MVRLAKPLNGRKVDVWKWPTYLPFPRYTGEEDIVAKEFIYSNKIDGEYYFDVKLTSKKAKFLDNAPPDFRYMWQQITAKRIDLVILTKNIIYIIEFKRYMLSSGIGQLLTYYHMFIKEYQPEGKIELIYATYYPDPDIVDIAKEYNIKTWSVVKL